ncbi:CAP domain-containing protein [Lactobacillus sp. Sy-1]|uniref:CAP domain-containing protein n=1 Tax=Lactobacillus sp. Sy-1 TaxID=2109645 RepID=UPI001C5B95ED|nr:CAP domain-containing protein [Lactobacillus sp. Sy-1]MBW1606364.1 CAP domain-containing protein [Lactobacillus sp. Sy-1]
MKKSVMYTLICGSVLSLGLSQFTAEAKTSTKAKTEKVYHFVKKGHHYKLKSVKKVKHASKLVKGKKFTYKGVTYYYVKKLHGYLKKSAFTTVKLKKKHVKSKVTPSSKKKNADSSASNNNGGNGVQSSSDTGTTGTTAANATTNVPGVSSSSTSSANSSAASSKTTSSSVSVSSTANSSVVSGSTTIVNSSSSSVKPVSGSTTIINSSSSSVKPVSGSTTIVNSSSSSVKPVSGSTTIVNSSASSVKPVTGSTAINNGSSSSAKSSSNSTTPSSSASSASASSNSAKSSGSSTTPSSSANSSSASSNSAKSSSNSTTPGSSANVASASSNSSQSAAVTDPGDVNPTLPQFNVGDTVGIITGDPSIVPIDHFPNSETDTSGRVDISNIDQINVKILAKRVAPWKVYYYQVKFSNGSTAWVTNGDLFNPYATPQQLSLTASDYTNAYNQALQYINYVRKNHGLNPLSFDSRISSLAKTRSTQLVSKFSHSDASGGPAYENLAKQAGYSDLASSYGENISYDGDTFGNPLNQSILVSINSMLYEDSGSEWGHRDNFLSPRFTKIGIGTSVSGSVVYTSFDFN